ncbi:TolC family protein [Massilia horti]|uniref:TolC family protein n=1 Tax=Massilia horti TaxID=2562153 RepID=A0A4Y9SVC2_9BURK|nr:TolC family protein [Massilia horti]TFW29164.1 TolC family protein [Massilia horti]
MPFLPCARHSRRAAVFFLVRWATGAALLCLCFVAEAADLLSLPEAQRLAVARSRQIAAENAAIDAARAMSVAAGQLPDPVLKAGVDNFPVTGPDRGSLTADFMTMRRIGISQEFIRSDKRSLRSERYLREADRTLAEKDKAIATVERDTAIAWLDRYYAEAMTSIVAAQRERAQGEEQAADAAYRSGRGSQADVLAAKAAVLQFDDRLDESMRRARSATIALGRWVGDAAARPLAGQPMIDTIRLDPSTLDTQLVHHPEVAAMVRQEEIAALEARLAQANKKADWTVEVAYQQRGPSFSNMVSVGVSVPLQWDQKNRQDRELAAKLALAEQRRAERDEMLREHVAETRALIGEWQTNRARLTRQTHELIPLAKERSEAVLAAYRGGKAMLVDVLAARRNELDVRLAALQLEADTARLWAQLNFLFPTSHGAEPGGVAVPRNPK